MQKLLALLFSLCFLSSCVTETWVKDYVDSQTGEVKTRVQAIDKDAAESKTQFAALREEINKGIDTAHGDYEARLDALRHDLSHVDARLHEFSVKIQESMAILEKDVHRDASNHESKLTVLVERVQKLDAEAVKLRETIQSMDKRVQELGNILYPLTGKEVIKQ